MTLEYWKYDAGTDSVAALVIPAALARTRTFDLDAMLLVQVPADAPEGWLELTVEVDGKRLWSRRIPTHHPGDTDNLEYPHRLTIEADGACGAVEIAVFEHGRIHAPLGGDRPDVVARVAADDQDALALLPARLVGWLCQGTSRCRQRNIADTG